MKKIKAILSHNVDSCDGKITTLYVIDKPTVEVSFNSLVSRDNFEVQMEKNDMIDSAKDLGKNYSYKRATPDTNICSSICVSIV